MPAHCLRRIIQQIQIVVTCLLQRYCSLHPYLIVIRHSLGINNVLAVPVYDTAQPDTGDDQLRLLLASIVA